MRGSIGVLMEARPATTEDPATHYLNRELSWLDFNERVLALAEDQERPILARVKFVAICSQSLDEFFQVRVSGLLEQVEAGVTATTPEGMRPEEQLAEIRDRVLATSARIERLFADELRPALDKEGIRLVDTADLTDEDRAFIEGRAMFFLASADREGRPDCSYKGGLPGFVRVVNARTLAYPSY